jgi:hypothetical protein
VRTFPAKPRDARGPARRTAALAGAALGLLLSLGAPRAEAPRVWAITGARIVVAPGEVIAEGTIVLRDGLIEAVGAAVPVPPDAVEIEASGGWVHAGFIDLHSLLGSAPPEAAARSASAEPAPAGPVHPLERVHPETRARDGLRPFADDGRREMERFRALGFTTVLAAPRAGLLRGQSVALQLAAERPVSALILRDDVAQHAAFEHGRFGEPYPTSLMGAIAALRQTLLDARRHATWSERWRRDPRGLARPEFPAAFAALAPLLSGAQPLFVEVDDPHDALVAHRLGHEFGLNVVIDASGHEWELADRIAGTGRTLLLPLGFPDEPDVDDDHEALDVSLRTLRRHVEAPAAAARLHALGVPLALTTRGLSSTADFRRNLRRVVEAGLPEETALAALTTVPAALTGLARVIGTLEAGKLANVVVVDGSPFDERASVTHVFVDGTRHAIEKPDRPAGDPHAVVDPRGTWSVVFHLGPRDLEREWKVEGEPGRYRGIAETQSGWVELESLRLQGNLLTAVLPAAGGRGRTEVTVVVRGDTFEGLAEAGARSIEVTGRRRGRPGGAP